MRPGIFRVATEGKTEMRREARTAATALKAAAVPKAAKGEPGRDAWMAWRDECWIEAKKQAAAGNCDMAVFLEACGSPD